MFHNYQILQQDFPDILTQNNFLIIKMRKLLRKEFIRTKARYAKKECQPETNCQKTNIWCNKLGNLLGCDSSKQNLTHLESLFNYYNRVTNDDSKEIDWNYWNSKIVTQGFVQRVRQNYEMLAKQQYSLQTILQGVFNTDAKQYYFIDYQMKFHTAIWIDNYFSYVQFLNDLNSVSSPFDYNPVEWLDLHPGIEEASTALIQTHSYFPGSRNDVDIWNYMNKQFAWGKKVVTFYRHPAEDFKDGKATQNSLGR